LKMIRFRGLVGWRISGRENMHGCALPVSSPVSTARIEGCCMDLFLSINLAPEWLLQGALDIQHMLQKRM
jgi:hypothetical protein